MKDLSIDNITQNAILVNSLSGNPRLTFLFERLTTHLHAFAQETRLSTEEWSTGLKFLEEVGQKCKEREEFILLSDSLGLSLLVDLINHPKPANATELSLRGPAHTHDGPLMEHGGGISHDPRGEPLLVLCSVKDSAGKPIERVAIDIWEADAAGNYDVFYPDREGPEGRCTMYSGADGSFWFKGIAPVNYPMPPDGPVHKMLEMLHRQPWRPAHVHFVFEKPGYDELTTAIYLRGDPFETSDPVFGVQESLLTEYEQADDATAKQYDVKPGTKVMKYDFVLASDKEVADVRHKRAEQALADLGHKTKWLDGLPVPDVD